MGDRTLACTSISCRLQDYIQFGLVFKPYFTLKKSAKMTIKSKSIVFKTDSSQRLDISYYMTEAVTYENNSIPAMAITLREAPRFFESRYRALSMQEDGPFSLVGLLEELAPYGPAQIKLLGLNTDHEKIVDSCLVYQVLLKKRTALHSQLKSLSEFRSMPQ